MCKEFFIISLFSFSIILFKISYIVGVCCLLFPSFVCVNNDTKKFLARRRKKNENWYKDKSYTETNEIKSKTLHWHTVKAFVLVHIYTHLMCAHSACVCAHARTQSNSRICVFVLILKRKRIIYTNHKMKKEKNETKKSNETECKHTWNVDGSTKGMMKGKNTTQATMGFLLIKCYYWVLTHNVEIAWRDFFSSVCLTCFSVPLLCSPSLCAIKFSVFVVHSIYIFEWFQ